MRKVTTALLSFFILSSCASTGVVMMDKDIYMIGKRSAQLGCGPPVAVKADLYIEANEFCAKSGKIVETIKVDMVDTLPARPGSVTLEFRCVEKL